jgi:hypothetical protein
MADEEIISAGWRDWRGAGGLPAIDLLLVGATGILPLHADRKYQAFRVACS